MRAGLAHSSPPISAKIAGQRRAQLKPAAASPHFLATRCVLTAAPDLHDARFLGFPAIFATILAAFFGRAVARPMSTLCTCFFGHWSKPPPMLGRAYSIV